MLPIRFTNEARADIATVNERQGDWLAKTLKNIANGATEYTEPLAFGYTDYSKVKPSATTRRFDMEIRAVIKITDAAIEVIAIGPRDSVYRTANRRIEAAYASAR